ncbi:MULTISPECIES: hypothetical protein [unclassified Micromonospora]|uniref:hypothetical protein n=1 Tax=unclassified Micromonospora TaxID=2617518 RepID=UPI003320ECA6
MHTIRVINYCGDHDDLNDINIIGPYPTAGDRDTDMHRLAELTDVHGSLEFQPSTLPPAAAVRLCQPGAVAGASDLDGVLAGLRLILPPADTTAAEPTLPGL